MNTPKTTAKDFFLWAGVVVSLYWSVLAFIFLIFDYINYAFPNPLSYYPTNPYQSGISYEMASIIILLPVALLLLRVIRRDITADASKNEIWVRRWALILTLFLAGLAVVVDLITLLTTFLNGEELTTAYLLKTLVVLLVAAGVFMHFIADLKGYWQTYPARRNMVAWGVAVLALVTIIAGFFIVGTPGDARKARFDEQRVSDLQNLQSQITYYYQAKQALPAMLEELSNSVTYGPLTTVDAETGAEYGYKATGALTFELCATFNAASRPEVNGARGYSVATMPIEMGGKGALTMNDWQHGAGETCFARTIDPAFYPPIRN